MDLKTWQALTDTEVGSLPETLADDIKNGGEVPPIPVAYRPTEAGVRLVDKELAGDKKSKKNKNGVVFAAATVSAGATALSAKELKRFLEKRKVGEEQLVTEIEDLRKKERNSKVYEPTLYITEYVDKEATLLNSYVTDYQTIIASDGKKKYKKEYKGKIDSLVKTYNTDLQVYRSAAETEVVFAPTTLSDDIRGKRPVPVFNSVSAPETVSEYRYKAEPGAASYLVAEPKADPKEEPVSEKEKYSEGVRNAGETDNVEKRSKKDLAKYLNKRDSEERKLIKRANTARKKHKKADGTERIAEMKKCLDSEVELINGYMDTYRITVASGIGKYKRSYVGKIKKAVKQYKEDAAVWTSLTDLNPDIPSDTLAKDISRGEEYSYLCPIVYNDEQPVPEKADPKKQRALENAEKASVVGSDVSVTAMSKKDLAKYLNKKDSEERKLIKTANTARKNHKKKVGKERIGEMKKCLDSEVDLINGYMDTYRITVLSGIGKYKRSYSGKLKKALRQYKKDAESWTVLTDMTADLPSDTLVRDIADKGEYEYLGYVFIKDAEEERKRDPKKDRAEEISEQKRFLKEENEREKRRESRIPLAIVDGREILITQAHMDDDIRTLKDKIDYRRERYSRHIELSCYRYGEKTGKEKKRLSEENAKLKAMKSGKGAVIKYRKKCNKRYLDLVMLDASTIKTRSKANSERLAELQARVENLLLERDEINRRLNALYAEENLKKNKKKRRNFRAKLASVRLGEVKRAFRGQRGNYRKISKFRVTLQAKQRVYDSMNKRIELFGYLAELKYRLKHERPKGAARRAIKKEIRDTKRRLKHTKGDISRGIVKLGKRSARTPNPKVQLLWLLLLLLIVAAVAVVIVFREPILAWITQLIAKFLPSK